MTVITAQQWIDGEIRELRAVDPVRVRVCSRICARMSSKILSSLCVDNELLASCIKDAVERGHLSWEVWLEEGDMSGSGVTEESWLDAGEAIESVGLSEIVYLSAINHVEALAYYAASVAGVLPSSVEAVHSTLKGLARVVAVSDASVEELDRLYAAVQESSLDGEGDARAIDLLVESHLGLIRS